MGVSTHPGMVIRTSLEERNWTQGDLADITGVGVRQINRIITGRAGISPVMARKLAAAFGTTPEHWMHLHNAYLLERAAQREAGLAKKRREALWV